MAIGHLLGLLHLGAPPQAMDLAGGNAQLFTGLFEGEAGEENGCRFRSAPPTYITGSSADPVVPVKRCLVDSDPKLGGKIPRRQGFKFLKMIVPEVFGVVIEVEAEPPAGALQGGASRGQVEEETPIPEAVFFPEIIESLGVDEAWQPTIKGNVAVGRRTEVKIKAVFGGSNVTNVPDVAVYISCLADDGELAIPCGNRAGSVAGRRRDNKWFNVSEIWVLHSNAFP